MVPIVVPPILAAVFGVIGAAAATRFLMREWRRVNAELDAAERERDAAQTGHRDPTKTLRRDPQTGVYRVE